MTATMDEAADLASAASPRLHCGLRQSIDAVSSADMEFGEPLFLPSQFTFAELSKQPAQRYYGGGHTLPHSNAAFVAGDIRSPGGALEVQQCLCQAVGWHGTAAVAQAPLWRWRERCDCEGLPNQGGEQYRWTA